MDKPLMLFEEKQYFGHNRQSIFVRTLLALFCFLAYYWSENPKPVQVSFVHIGSYPLDNTVRSGTVFFLIGLAILLFSAVLTFVVHIKTTVYSDHLELDGFWTSRRVKLDLDQIETIRKSRYKRTIFRRMAYNLHHRGIIRFYTSGESFVEIRDKAGYVYRIGSKRPVELFNILKAGAKI